MLEALRARGDHPTAEDVYRDLRSEGEEISLATVYRTLRSLEQERWAQVLHGVGADRFDARTDRHYHLHCSACGRTVDLELPYQETLDEAVRGLGAEVSYHVLVFFGRCPQCARTKGEEAGCAR